MVYHRCKFCGQLSPNLAYVVHRNRTWHLVLVCDCHPDTHQYIPYIPGLEIPTIKTRQQKRGQQTSLL